MHFPGTASSKMATIICGLGGEHGNACDELLVPELGYPVEGGGEVEWEGHSARGTHDEEGSCSPCSNCRWLSFDGCSRDEMGRMNDNLYASGPTGTVLSGHWAVMKSSTSSSSSR